MRYVMKKKYLLGILFSVFTLIFVSACNSPSNIKANFKKSEYTLSVGEGVNFFNEFSVSGIEKAEVKIISSNPEIIDQVEDDANFVAKSSGSAYILAKYNQDVVAQVKVNVRYKYSSPKNISVSKDGKLTWDESYVKSISTGALINAAAYKLKYGLVEEGKTIKYTSATPTTNSFMLPNKQGVYSIKLQAVSYEDEYDSSDEVTETVNFGVMGYLENVKLANHAVGSSATLRWKEKDNAVYDVYVEGFNVASGESSSEFTHDFSQYTANEIFVEVVAKPEVADGSLQTTTGITLYRLGAPTLSETAGTLTFSNISNATGYVLQNFNDASDIVEVGTGGQTILEGKESGLYTYKAKAIGNQNSISVAGTGRFKGYLNSDFSSVITVAKLATPQYSYVITKTGVEITFMASAVDVNYQITYGNVTKVISAAEGHATIDMSSLTEGDYQFSIQAIPTNSTTVTQGLSSTQNVLKSDVSTFSVYKQGVISELTHSLDGKKSTISFAKLLKANRYSLYVNGNLVTTSYSSRANQISFSIDDLSAIASAEGKYTFKVEAYTETDGVVTSTTSSVSKEVSILPLTTKSATQTNGYYSWNEISGAKYYYEVFKTDKNYTITENTPVQSGETVSTSISQVLNFGYYKIHVYTKSTDFNTSLDSDFENSARCFEDNFFVTEQIAAPTVQFIDDDGSYKLQITISEYASCYVVEIDGAEDSRKILLEHLWEEDSAVTVTHQLINQFENVDDYEIKVVAKAGDLYDGTIHLDSSPTSLTVTRVAQAAHRVELSYDSFNRLSNIYLVAEKPATASSIKATRGTTELTVVPSGENGLIDMAGNDFGTNFSVNLISEGKAAANGHYYIDSHSKSVGFERVSSPRNLAYSNGVLSFELTDEKVEKFLLYITIFEDGSPSLVQAVEVASNQRTVDFDEIIQNMLSTNSTFAAAFNSMDNLKVAVQSVANSTYSGKHFIPSAISDELTIEDLEASTLSFNQNTETLSWTQVEAGASYDLYLNGSLAMADLTNTSIALSAISGIDLTNLQTIAVVSKHSKYFDSKMSNEIKVKRLSGATSAVVAKKAGSSELTINFTEGNAVEKVLVNGNIASMNAGATSASINISANGEHKVQVVAKAGEIDGVYYINSQEVPFILQQVGTISLTQVGDVISWNNPSLNVMRRNSLNPYVVNLKLVDAEGSIEKTYSPVSTEIRASEIESLFGVDFDDNTKDFTISAQVVFTSPYSLNITERDAVGLYGESAESNLLTINKLQSIGTITVTQSENESALEKVTAKMTGTVNFTFADRWSALANVKFAFVVDGASMPIIPAVEANIPGIYSLKLDDDKWTLSIPMTMFNMNNITVKVNVVSVGNVASDETTISLTRLRKVGGATLSSEGILSITDSQNADHYAVALIHPDGEKWSTFTKSEISSIDITTTDWLGAFGAGDYVIKVIAYSQDGTVLPSIEVLEYAAHAYTGIKNAEIDAEGRIVLTVDADVYTNAVFTAKLDVDFETYVAEFTPTLIGEADAGADSKFYIAMKDAVKLFADELTAAGVDIYREYEVMFTVRDNGGVNAPWRDVRFVYSGEYEPEYLPVVKRAGYDEDYIIFAYDNFVTTKSIAIDYLGQYTITDEDGNETVVQVSGQKTYSELSTALEEVYGYWIENTAGEGRFSPVNDSNMDETALACHAIKINDVLVDLPYGEYTIMAAKTIVAGGGVHTQYLPITISGYKLCSIYQDEDAGDLGLKVTNGYMLEWDFVQQDLSAGAKLPNYYYVVAFDGTNTKKFLTNLAVYDLRTCGLDAGKEYEVCVVAVNSDANILASNQSVVIKVEQYSTPAQPTEKLGVLGFDLTQSEGLAETFYGDMVAYFTGTNTTPYEETLLEKERYQSPFTFDFYSLLNARIRIKFTAISAEGAEGKNYYITIPAIDLLMDYEIDGNSYYNLLETYLNSVTDAEVQLFIQNILSSKRGLASDRLLFDDLGSAIPKGVYEVSFVQNAYDNGGEVKYIESTPTTTYRIYLSAGASIELDQGEFEGKENQYLMTVTPNKTATTSDGINYIETTALMYKMRLKAMASSDVYTIDYVYDSIAQTWTGTFLGSDINLTSVGDILITLPQTNSEGIHCFRLNISALRDVMTLLLEEEGQTFNIRTEYKVDIYATSNGEQGVVNGKSGTFTLAYQDFDVENMHLENGVVVLPATSAGNLIVRYAYYLTAGAVQEECLPISKGTNIVDLSNIVNGGNQLAFVTFAMQGNYTYNSMSVESKIYGISMPYKLSNPNVASRNNNLEITYLNADVASGVLASMRGYITYVVSNNNGGVHSSNTTTNKISYQVGLYSEEKNASQFYVNLQGNNGDFVRLESGDAYYQSSPHYDYQLALAAGNQLLFAEENVLATVIFKSGVTTIDAKMLDYRQAEIADFYQLSKGSLYFNLPLTFTSDISDEDGNDGEIIYKVDLKYYDKHDANVNPTPVETQAIYLHGGHVNAEGKLYLDAQFINRQRDLVSVEVAALVAVPMTTAGQANIETVDGKYYSTERHFYYSDGTTMLRSETVPATSENVQVKFSHPTIAKAPTSAGVLAVGNGEITFVTDSHIATTDGELKNAFDWEMIVLATDSSGNQVELPSKVKVWDDVEGRMAVLVPDEFGQTALASLKGNKFNISIMTYDNDQLLSMPYVISGVYKLPDIDGMYEIKVVEKTDDAGAVVGYSTYIDFSRYFENFKVLGANDFYALKFTVHKSNGTSATSYLTKSSYTFELGQNIESISIQAVDNQVYSASNRVLLLHSDVLEVSVEETVYDNANIIWNSTIVGYEWQGGETGKSYEYYYKLIVSGLVENGITLDEFYLPQNMGVATSFFIQARDLSTTGADGKPVIHIFSENVEADASQVNKTIGLFAGGNGSQNKPYIIKTVTNQSTGVVENKAIDQFNAIALRNYAGVYFKLMENIEINIGENYTPLAAFNGHFIGNNNTITINASTTYALSNNYTVNNVASNTYMFNQYSSLFEKVSANATVSNLRVDYTIHNNTLNSNYILYAPIAAQNYGNITDVTVTSFKVSALGGTGSNRAFMAGIAGANFGNIIDCHNESGLNYQTAQQLNILVAYAGITCFNDVNLHSGVTYTGSLLDCSNSGSIKIVTATSGLTIYATGITVKNGGFMYACANTAAITVSGYSSSHKGIFYVAGVAISNVAGTMKLSYNSGTTSTANASSSYIAGVATMINSGAVSGLVNVTSSPLVYSCGGSVSSAQCYVLSGVELPPSFSANYLTGEVNNTLRDVAVVGGKTYNISLTISSAASGASYSYSASLSVVQQ